MSWVERYQHHNSPVHRLDPRVKLVTALTLIIGIIITPDNAFFAYLLLWLLVAGLLKLSRLNVWRVGRMAALALVFALAAATLIFTTPGDALLSWQGITITDTGLTRFAAIVLKNWLAVQVALLLSMTTSLPDLLYALDSLYVPHTLVAIIGFMYRYLFILQDEAQRLVRARISRSATIQNRKAGGGLLWRARITGGMIGSLFLRNYERSERVYAAMLARGYNGHMQTPGRPPLKWQAVVQGMVPILAVILIQVLSASL